MICFPLLLFVPLSHAERELSDDGHVAAHGRVGAVCGLRCFAKHAAADPQRLVKFDRALDVTILLKFRGVLLDEVLDLLDGCCVGNIDLSAKPHTKSHFRRAH